MDDVDVDDDGESVCGQVDLFILAARQMVGMFDRYLEGCCCCCLCWL